MRPLWLALAALGAGMPAQAQELPAGWAQLYDVQFVAVSGGGVPALVLRYLAPEIGREGGSLSYDDVAPELDEICNGDGILAAASVAALGQPIAEIVVTVMDRPIEWGTADPEATMFREAYLLGEEGCQWQ
ncbi:hypothetical protein IV417_01340 [Alphaproteobacteria bacterium KMM 3653]|uniref:Uncharacterized protein n=1 Tax=Harenicola maris TaxID=2841044 RepID=A0AAP2CKB3_9RHOB|nr:hypothetical protein [Harenicola maris]